MRLRSYHRGASSGTSTRGTSRARTMVTCGQAGRWVAVLCTCVEEPHLEGTCITACAACLQSKVACLAATAGVVQPPNAQDLGDGGEGPRDHLEAEGGRDH